MGETTQVAFVGENPRHIQSSPYILKYHFIWIVKTFESDNVKKNLKSWINGVFMFSIVWSIGASVDIDGRSAFSEFLLEAQEIENLFQIFLTSNTMKK